MGHPEPSTTSEAAQNNTHLFCYSSGGSEALNPRHWATSWCWQGAPLGAPGEDLFPGLFELPPSPHSLAWGPFLHLQPSVLQCLLSLHPSCKDPWDFTWARLHNAGEHPISRPGLNPLQSHFLHIRQHAQVPGVRTWVPLGDTAKSTQLACLALVTCTG